MDGLKRKREVPVECYPTTNTIKTGWMSTIDDLTESILIEIFVRIPAKYAHRCKSVCKRWNFLISDPYFVSQFMRQNKHLSSSSSSSWSPLPLLVFSYLQGYCKISDKETVVCKISDKEMFSCREYILNFLPCFQPDDPRDPCVVASSGGLLLCSPTWYYQSVYFVCNPVTMNWIELPPPPHRHYEVDIGFVCVPYWANKEEESITNSRYKFSVVRFPVWRRGFSSFDLEFFSSEDGEWSEKSVFCPHGIDLSPPRMTPVVYNGIVHFLSPQSGIFVYNPYGNDIIHRFGIIDLPSDVDNSTNMYLGMFQGRLRLSHNPIFIGNDEESSTLMIWELEDYNTGYWCLAHKVCLRKMVSDSPRVMERLNPGHCSMKVIAFDSNDGDVVYMWSNASTIVLCNLHHMTMKEMSGTPYVPYDHMVFPLELPCWPAPFPTLPRKSPPLLDYNATCLF